MRQDYSHLPRAQPKSRQYTAGSNQEQRDKEDIERFKNAVGETLINFAELRAPRFQPSEKLIIDKKPEINTMNDQPRKTLTATLPAATEPLPVEPGWIILTNSKNEQFYIRPEEIMQVVASKFYDGCSFVVARGDSRGGFGVMEKPSEVIRLIREEMAAEVERNTIYMEVKKDAADAV